MATLAAFTVEGVTAQAVVGRLSAAGINVSLTPASYSRLGLERRGLDAVVRGSVHYTNTDEELKRLVDVVAGVGSSGA